MPSLTLLTVSSAAALCRLHRSLVFYPGSISSSKCCSSLLVSSIASFSSNRRAYFSPHFICAHRHLSAARDHQSVRLLHAVIAASASKQTVDDLPCKLLDIVKLFQLAPDPRAKYEQLLHYGRRLKPLSEEYQTLENKVQGCVSQVWVRASIDEEKRIHFEAESDSMLTRGLAALLVEGLSGSLAADVLKITPDFIQMLGLNQSLTPSRSNGFLNMFKLMQKKTLELAMEAEGGSDGVITKDVNSTGNLSDEVGDLKGSSPTDHKENTQDRETKTRKEVIRQKIETALDPVLLEVEDVSYKHAGHAGVHQGATETHFNLKIVSPMFEGKTLVKRHRLVYEILQEELQNGLHALSIVAKTPAEIDCT
ncbi:hypothetical protein KP509_36G021300 [Ceratopteris richardii]|uniref:Fe-S metabolism associated domain-containing protein n=1 Tax=Ceratopteris richardii TaxID=49495 RepID=A0A8T2QB48_CERRI|nr:hypothetical protein KP509_36G021300 [Ceratopteris richardii]